MRDSRRAQKLSGVEGTEYGILCLPILIIAIPGKEVKMADDWGEGKGKWKGRDEGVQRRPGLSRRS
jgi:hypothetical protein